MFWLTNLCLALNSLRAGDCSFFIILQSLCYFLFIFSYSIDLLFLKCIKCYIFFFLCNIWQRHLFTLLGHSFYRCGRLGIWQHSVTSSSWHCWTVLVPFYFIFIYFILLFFCFLKPAKTCEVSSFVTNDFSKATYGAVLYQKSLAVSIYNIY